METPNEPRMAWVCPYCGKEHSEEMARYKGCCGEVHCEYVEVDDEA